MYNRSEERAPIAPRPPIPDYNYGYNSDDERGQRRPQPTPCIQPPAPALMPWERRGWRIARMAEDGACLFRAIGLSALSALNDLSAFHVYGDAEMHDQARRLCMDYMVQPPPIFYFTLSPPFAIV